MCSVESFGQASAYYQTIPPQASSAHVHISHALQAVDTLANPLVLQLVLVLFMFLKLCTSCGMRFDAKAA